MNDMIKELSNQAYDELVKETGNIVVFDEDLQQRFAELLIKECISIVEEQKECLCEEQQYWSDHDYGYEMAVNDASMGIKQFFGVEECH